MSKSSFSLSVGAVAMLLLSSMVVVIKAQPHELIYEQSIRTNKKCYLRGEPIYINFINQDWKTDDWVGIYPANTRLNDLTLSTLKMWVWTCGSQDRQCKVEYATVKLESLRDARLNNWPLRNGKYMAVLGRNGDEPYTHIVNSAAFSVENSCNVSSFYQIPRRELLWDESVLKNYYYILTTIHDLPLLHLTHLKGYNIESKPFSH